MRGKSEFCRSLSPWLLGITLSISLVSTSCSTESDTSGEVQAAATAMPIQILKLQSNTIQDSSEFVGNLEAVKIVQIRPEIQGRIEKILVKAGDRVEAGQSIMMLKPDESAPKYEAALSQVDVAKGNYQNALKQMDIARAKRDSAKTESDLANAYLPKLQTLVNEGGLAQVQLDEVLLRAETAKNNLITTEQEIAAAEVKVQQAETSIRQAQAEANASLVSVNNKAVIAPIAGVVDNLPVKEGDYVSAGQSVVAKVAQSDDLFLNIQVPSNRARQLKPGLRLDLLDPTSKEQSKEQLSTGELIFVSPTIDSAGQTILAKARFSNENGELRDGQYVEARITWDTQRGLLIPTKSISSIGGKEFVYQVSDKPNENGQEVVSLTLVELGAIQGNSYQVISGLETGDRIAISNILKLKDGVPVQPES